MLLALPQSLGTSAEYNSLDQHHWIQKYFSFLTFEFVILTFYLDKNEMLLLLSKVLNEKYLKFERPIVCRDQFSEYD